VNGDPQRAVQDEGLELLGPHHGAQSRTGRDAAAIVGDARDEGTLLPGGTDGGDAGARSVPRGQGRFRIGRVPAPEIGGVAQLRAAVPDEEIDRLCGDPAEEDGIVTASLDGRRKGPAGVRISPSAG